MDCSLPVASIWPKDSPGKNCGVSCHALPLGDLHNAEIEPASLNSPALADGFFTSSTPAEPLPEQQDLIKLNENLQITDKKTQKSKNLTILTWISNSRSNCQRFGSEKI